MDQTLNQAPAKPAPISDGTPYFFGNEALVTFSAGEGEYAPNTYFLVDKNAKTLTPFVDDQALQSAFGEDFEAAKSSAVTVAIPTIGEDGSIQNGIFKGYHILGAEHAVQSDGSAKKAEFSPFDLSRRYDKPVDDGAEKKALSELDELLNQIRVEGEAEGIPPGAIDKLMKDQKLIAFWVNSLAYGGYDIADVWTDIKQRVNKDTPVKETQEPNF